MRIAKYVALRNAGTPGQDLRLLMVRDTTFHSYHAVLATRLHGQWLLLDNRWRRLIPDNEGRFFRPLFALDAPGVDRFAAAGGNHRRTHVKRIAKRIAKSARQYRLCRRSRPDERRRRLTFRLARSTPRSSSSA